MEDQRYNLGEIVNELDSNENLRRFIEEHQGFYFLRGRSGLVESRLDNNKLSIEKYKISRRVVKWLRYVPYVRMAALTGTLAMKNTKDDSDLDFFIMIKGGRIWTGRTLATVVIHLLGKRRYGEKVKDRVCLNYFIASDSLEIDRQDLFASNEYTFIFPIFGFKQFRKFCERNKWISNFKINWVYPKVKPTKVGSHTKSSRAVQRFLEKMIDFFGGDWLENKLRAWEIKRIERNPNTSKFGSYIRYSDKNLIFFPEPQGPRVFEEFKRRLKVLTRQTG